MCRVRPVLVVQERQASREHLFKERPAWEQEIRTPWKETGNLSVKRGYRGGSTVWKSKRGFGNQAR